MRGADVLLPHRIIQETKHQAVYDNIGDCQNTKLGKLPHLPFDHDILFEVVDGCVFLRTLVQ